jgi:hypothetical protein
MTPARPMTERDVLHVLHAHADGIDRLYAAVVAMAAAATGQRARRYQDLAEGIDSARRTAHHDHRRRKGRLKKSGA